MKKKLQNTDRGRVLFGRLVYGLMFGLAILAGYKLALVWVLFLSRTAGELVSLFTVIITATIVYLFFRKLQPKNQEVWNLEGPIVNVDAAVLILWYFLLAFLMVVIYMSLNVFRFPFLLLKHLL